MTFAGLGEQVGGSWKPAVIHACIKVVLEEGVASSGAVAADLSRAEAAG